MLGRLLVFATVDRLRDLGPPGLLPSPGPKADSRAEDEEYRHLLLAWTHLKTHALVCPEVARQVAAAEARIEGVVRLDLGASLDRSDSADGVAANDLWWATLRGLTSARLAPRPDDGEGA